MRAVTIATAAFAIALTLAAELIANAPQEEFLIVRGTGYEGAIVQASTPSYAMHRFGLPPGTTSSSAWTPSPADIATLEAALTVLLTPGTLDQSPNLVMDVPESVMGLAWLRQNVQTLKRQYFGIQIGNSRQI